VFRNRLISENACFYPVWKFFSFHIFTENIKINISEVLGKLVIYEGGINRSKGIKLHDEDLHNLYSFLMLEK
jgi:hypothetical protein